MHPYHFETISKPVQKQKLNEELPVLPNGLDKDSSFKNKQQII
jgi:hypothetical protein